MELFRIENGLAVLDNPGVAMVKEFKTIITKDTDRNKRNAFRSLAFVYLYSDYRSPFFNEPSERKVNAIKRELSIPDSWELDKDIAVMEAIAKYEILTETPIIRLLKKARQTIEKIEVYFDEVDFTERNDKTNALVFTPREVFNAIAEIGDAHAGLNKLEEEIRKERGSKSRVQGGGSVGMFET